MNTKLLISTFIVIILAGFASGLYIGLTYKDGGTDAVAEPAENGSLAGSFIVTAYCPCKKCCGKWSDGHFANGQEVSFPAIAAPPNIPFGTRINVPGYGVAKVKDRGGAIKGNKLDVYFPDHEQAKAWGKQTLTVEILK